MVEFKFPDEYKVFETVARHMVESDKTNLDIGYFNERGEIVGAGDNVVQMEELAFSYARSSRSSYPQLKATPVYQRQEDLYKSALDKMKAWVAYKNQARRFAIATEQPGVGFSYDRINLNSPNKDRAIDVYSRAMINTGWTVARLEAVERSFHEQEDIPVFFVAVPNSEGGLYAALKAPGDLLAGLTVEPVYFVANIQSDPRVFTPYTFKREGMHVDVLYALYAEEPLLIQSKNGYQFVNTKGGLYPRTLWSLFLKLTNVRSDIKRLRSRLEKYGGPKGSRGMPSDLFYGMNEIAAHALAKRSVAEGRSEAKLMFRMNFADFKHWDSKRFTSNQLAIVACTAILCKRLGYKEGYEQLNKKIDVSMWQYYHSYLYIFDRAYDAFSQNRDEIQALAQKGRRSAKELE